MNRKLAVQGRAVEHAGRLDGPERAPGREPHMLMVLQQSAGNSAVSQLMSGGLQRQPVPGLAPRGPVTTRSCCKGDSGPAVRHMQSELKMALDEAAFTVNGEFDASTTHALKRFQSQAGLEPGGVVGPHTWAALDSVKGGVPESAEDSQRISDLYLAGLGMFDAGNFDGALAKFTDVYPDRAARHKATYLVPYMMAACHHNKGRFADAVSLYEEALAMPTTTMDDRGSSMENLRRARLGEGFMTGAEMAQGQAQGSAAGP